MEKIAASNMVMVGKLAGYGAITTLQDAYQK
jgi:hypothetical protein